MSLFSSSVFNKTPQVFLNKNTTVFQSLYTDLTERLDWLVSLKTLIQPNLATFTCGVTPASLAVTPDNKFAYVANNNNYGITGSDSVTVLNLSNLTVETTINDVSFSQPYTVTSNKDGTKMYVTNSFSTTVSIIDTKTNTVSNVITGFNGPSGFAITSDGSTAYVNNYGAGGSSGMGTTVNTVNLLTNTISGSITVGLAPASVAIRPDGRYVYTINYVDGLPNHGTMSVINTSTNTVVATINNFFGPFSIAITSDSKKAVVTNFGSNNFVPYGSTVSIVDLTTNEITATVNAGIQPSGVAISPDNLFAYITKIGRAHV